MIKLKHLLAEQHIDYNINTTADAILNDRFRLYDEKNNQIVITMDDDVNDNKVMTMKATRPVGIKDGTVARLEFHYDDPEDNSKQVEEFFAGVYDGEAVFDKISNSHVIKYIKQIKITNLGE